MCDVLFACCCSASNMNLLLSRDVALPSRDNSVKITGIIIYHQMKKELTSHCIWGICLTCFGVEIFHWRPWKKMYAENGLFGLTKFLVCLAYPSSELGMLQHTLHTWWRRLWLMIITVVFDEIFWRIEHSNQIKSLLSIQCSYFIRR